MYIAQAFNSLHDWWRYAVGIMVVVVGVFVFSLPHIVAVFIKRLNAEVDLLRLDDVNYLMSLFDSNTNLVFLLLPFVGGLIFLFGIVKLLHKQTITSLTTSRKKIDWKRIFFAFFFWGIISSGMVLLDYYLAPESYIDNFELNRFLVLAAIAILLLPIQTSCEEYLFRGYLMQGIGVVTNSKWIPLVITSLIFGLLHISNPEVDKLGYIIMVYYIGTGLFLGVITLMDEGMELALGFHAANNLFTALLVTANWTALQTHSVFKDVSEPESGIMDIVLPVFIIFPIILFIFSRVYKWSNWKDKLFGTVIEPSKDNYKILD
ncbi:CPBP family intramembrane glutamic endopeptidase [Lacinutrix sp.]|uniref:CPBP family intramembrane glutamic endopeptidase n=1 Tax=Lacinutrix sp. TaxID=1937692 RepID=UPI002604EB86|nr:CPBP family intramembrane glutamic endopeptidase [Lacinutrix sp.]MDG1715623.1 CPBP family intramembrane metalloprotease [Lacinutrix sp.]